MQLKAPPGTLLTDVVVNLPVKVNVRPRGVFSRAVWRLLRFDYDVLSVKGIAGDGQAIALDMEWAEAPE